MQEKSATGPALSLEHLVTSGCRDGNCPTVYRTNRGTFVVQGYAVTPEQAGVDLPAGELLVEIPPDLLAGVVRILDGGRGDQPAPAQSNSVN